MTKRHYTKTDITESSIVKRVRPTRTTTVPNITARKEVDSIAQGKVFCILSSSPTQPSVADLEDMVLKHGGEIVKNPGEIKRTYKNDFVIKTTAFL